MLRYSQIYAGIFPLGLKTYQVSPNAKNPLIIFMTLVSNVKMAKEAVKKLDEKLKCTICLDTYTDPKLLQCFHIYCQKCLVKLVIRDEQGELSLTCPTCRQATPVPANGVRGFQPAFQTHRLLEIKESLNKVEDPVASQKSAEVDVTCPTPSSKTPIGCSEHNKEQELYCETCEELICWKCAIRGGKHESHDYKELVEAFTKYKEEMKLSLEPMEEKLRNMNKALTELDGRCDELSNQQETVEANIHDTIGQLYEFLEVRKTELISQLHKLTQDKLKCLAFQKNEIKTIQAQLNNCLDLVKESLKTENQAEVLKIKTTIVKQIKELTTPFQPKALKPNTEADITFSASQEVTALCQNYGIVYAAQDPCPSKCHVTGKNLEVAMVGEMSTVVLQTVNFRDEPLTMPVEPQCELVSEITGATVRGNIERRGQDKYEISYQPTIKGWHQLHIKVEDQHIRGSPFTVMVKLPVKELGTSFLTIGKVRGPWGVAVNMRGEMVVTELSKHCVSVFNSSGEKLSFGTYGSGQGQFKYPCGVAVDGEGNILVADQKNHRIQKFTADGHFLAMVGTEGSKSLQFNYVFGIAYNTSNGKVYTVDMNHRVQILNSDFTFYKTFGEQGSDKGQFNYPQSIACDSNGKVYVADTNSHRIQIFTAEGEFLRMFGKHGEGVGELNYPVGIAVDNSNVVYVANRDNRCVSIFTSEGQFIKHFGRYGKRPGEFYHPRSIAVDDNGVVYVCDCDNNCVQVF